MEKQRYRLCGVLPQLPTTVKMTRLITLVLGLCLVACGGSDDGGRASDDAAASGATASTERTTAGSTGEVEYVPLSQQNVERWFAAFEDVMTLVASDPDLVHVLDTEDTETSASALERFQSEPRVVAAIRENGLEPAEYFGIMNTLIAAMFTYPVAQEGQLTELPPNLRQSDLDFYAANQQRIEQRWNEINARLPGYEEDE